MLNKNLISVILPAYNAEKYLRESIDSILKQTYKYFELIILNDGSTDSTENIILSYNDPRIIYVKNERNIKLIKTLNKGIDIAKGEYIARMDADDISLPTRLEEEFNMFRRDPKLGIVSCFPNNISDNGKFLSRSSFFVCTQSESCRFVSAIEPPFLHPGVMVKAEHMKKYKYNDSQEFYHIEDFELWHRMLEDGIKCAVLPKYLVNYRNTLDGICNTHNSDQYIRGQKLTKSNLAEWGITNYEVQSMTSIKYKIADNYKIFQGAIWMIDRLESVFLKKYDVNVAEKREIRKWCNQRKFAIVMTSLLKKNFKVKLLGWLLFRPYLYMNTNNILYLKNRLVRIHNEKKINT